MTLSLGREVTVLEEILPSRLANIAEWPLKVNNGITTTVAGMEAYRSSSSEEASTPALSMEMPKTCDLFATALHGLWLWVLLLVFLFRGLCTRSASSRPASLLPAHNCRSVAVLCTTLIQLACLAEAIWKFQESADPHILLITAAALTLVASLATAAFYHATEKWCAPGYVWVCLWVWVFQVGLGMWRVWQIARSGMRMTLVYPCLTFANTVTAAFILSLDLYTVMLWEMYISVKGDHINLDL
ncbi:uncharacterized protein [Palaemon carinicauda]|uniref:uncharacterized protein n=1 Tax=Palaemon carinicauda TaxID=392227 RepID=UPI0035B611EE